MVIAFTRKDNEFTIRPISYTHESFYLKNEQPILKAIRQIDTSDPTLFKDEVTYIVQSIYLNGETDKPSYNLSYDETKLVNEKLYVIKKVISICYCKRPRQTEIITQ